MLGYLMEADGAMFGTSAIGAAWPAPPRRTASPAPWAATRTR